MKAPSCGRPQRWHVAEVIRGSSLWPAVTLHLLLNAYVGARAAGVPGFEETLSAWTTILFYSLPLPALGLLLLRREASNRPAT